MNEPGRDCLDLVWVSLIALAGAANGCTSIPCPSGYESRGSDCKRMEKISRDDAGAQTGEMSGAQQTQMHMADGGSAPDASAPGMAMVTGSARPDAQVSDSGPRAAEGMAAQDAAMASSPAAAAAAASDAGPNLPGLMTNSTDQVDQDLGACPEARSARLVTRHSTIALPKPGAPTQKLLSFRCQSDARPGLMLTARFTLHNQGASDATVRCALATGASERDEASLTLPSAGFGAAFMQVATAAENVSAEPQGTLQCEVLSGDGQVAAESVKVLVRTPASVSLVAAP